MARRRKYFTEEQKLNARRERQLRYYYRNKLGLNNLLVNRRPKRQDSALIDPATSIEEPLVSDINTESTTSVEVNSSPA